MTGTHGKLVPKKVFLAAGNSHHVTKACALLCWMLLDFGQQNCCWRTKFGYLTCRLQPPERPASAFFRSAGTVGAVTAGKRSETRSSHGLSTRTAAHFLRLLFTAVWWLECFQREHAGVAQSIARLPPRLLRFPPRRPTTAPKSIHLACVLGVLERRQRCFDS